MKPNPYNIVTPNLVVVGPPLLDDHFAGQEFPQGKPMPTKTAREKIHELIKQNYNENTARCVVALVMPVIDALLEEARQDMKEKCLHLIPEEVPEFPDCPISVIGQNNLARTLRKSISSL